VKYNNRMQFDPGYYETLTPGFRLGFPEVEGPYTFHIGTSYVPRILLRCLREARGDAPSHTGSYEYEAIDGSYLYLVITQADPSQ